MVTEDEQLHIFFFPFMAHGHMIPMLDIARLFAVRGTKSTIITTPRNALYFTESLDSDRQSGLDIGVLTIPFPAVEVGLPEGCEDQTTVTSQEMITKFFKAMNMLQQPFKQLLQQHRPDCVVADKFFPWTTDVAKIYKIPRLVFHGECNFPQCVLENIQRFAPQRKARSDSEIFVVPGLPDQIEMTKSQFNHGDARVSDMQAKVQETEETSYGVLVNSFYEMEPAYAEYYKKDMGRRAWNIGPVSLYNKSILNKAQRGMKMYASIDEHHCLNWLDSKKPNSVIYASFGSLYRFSAAQLLEIAMGLEASEIPFIWVVKVKDENDHFLPEGFEERMEGKGLIIRDWAPQVLILDHPTVGGFMTHCGWNSILEGITAGLPLITWPLFAEQFQNEKLVTQVLKIGIGAGNRTYKSWMDPDTVIMPKERIEEVVIQLMRRGKEAEDMRRRARELGEVAKRVVEKGGSSYNDLLL